MRYKTSKAKPQTDKRVWNHRFHRLHRLYELLFFICAICEICGFWCL